jgi:hypothetical protein
MARGRCNCGTVMFQYSGTPTIVLECRCRVCRECPTGPYVAATVVGTNQFVWVKGYERIQSYVAASGERSDFCSRCGSRMPCLFSHIPYVWIPTSSIDRGVEIGHPSHRDFPLHSMSAENACLGTGRFIEPDVTTTLTKIGGMHWRSKT